VFFTEFALPVWKGGRFLWLRWQEVTEASVAESAPETAGQSFLAPANCFGFPAVQDNTFPPFHNNKSTYNKQLIAIHKGESS
jgi:hypothetical protein